MHKSKYSNLKRSDRAFLIRPKCVQQLETQIIDGSTSVWDRFQLDTRGLEIIELISKDGICLGILLGTPIDYHHKRIVKGHFQLELSALDCVADIDRVESAIYTLNGSWLAIVVVGQIARLYVDANATLGVVYDAEHKMAGPGASELLSESEYWERLNWKLHEALGVSKLGWFPSGLTAHDGISQLLPNHYLDLNTWTPIRHWPKEQLVLNVNYEQNLDRIAQIVLATIETVVADGLTAMALTGGNESRCLTMLSRSLWQQIEFVTVAYPEAEQDVVLAKRIADRYNLPHHILKAYQGSQLEEDTWLYQANHCIRSTADATHGPSLKPLEKYDYFIIGLGGEVARGILYRPNDGKNTKIVATGLIHRMGLPAIEPLITLTTRWLEQLTVQDIHTLLDLAYIELRTGPWGSAGGYADYPTNQLHPLVCREVYTLMLQLPSEVKASNGIRALTSRYYPDALSIPINSYGDLRDYWPIIRKLMQPSIVIRNIREMLG